MRTFTIFLLNIAGFLWFGFNVGWPGTLGLFLILWTNNWIQARFIIGAWHTIIVAAEQRQHAAVCELIKKDDDLPRP